jgi:hypothetical protein
MTTLVSGLITNINFYRSIDKYIEFGKILCNTNINKIIFIEKHIYDKFFKDEVYKFTTFIFTSKEELYLYKYIDYNLQNFNRLSTDNPLKDTLEYMFIQNNKIEWVREAIEKNPYNSNDFVWVDFGIYHMINDYKIFNDYINGISNKTYKNIRIASSLYSNTTHSIYTNINWFFLGSVFGGNSKKLIQLADLTRKKCIDTILNENTLMWEINIWYLVYLEHPYLFDPYKANHNPSILINY